MNPFADRPYAAGRFARIVAISRENNPFYARWIEDPDRVPVLDRRTYCENNDEILNGHAVNDRTSGSTGVPVRVAVSPDLARARARDTALLVGWLGGRLPVVRLIYVGHNRPAENTLDIGVPIDEQIDFILMRHRVARAVAVTTYPTNAELLVRRAHERGVDLGFIRRVGLYGESVEPHHISLIRSVFPNANVWSTYSSVEFGLIAARCPYEPRYHHVMAHRLGVELLDDRDVPVGRGERGRVVITDYLNTWSPFIRYELGDYADAGICPCGRIPLPSIGEVYGKIRGALLHRDGRRVVFADLSVRLRDIPAMRQYQVVQHDVEGFTVRVVSAVPIDADVRSAFAAHFGYVPAQVNIEYVDEIPRGPGGKFHASICEV